MSLPIVQDENQNLMLVQRNWKSKLDPVFNNPLLNGKNLINISLNQGSTKIPHGLNGVPAGWFLTDLQGPLSQPPYRSAPFDNQNLTLTSVAAVTVSIWVY